MVLQRLAPDGTQKKLAHLNDVSESTITRWKEDVEHVMRLAAQLDLKLVDSRRECIPAAELKMLRRVYALAADQVPWLLQEDEG